jgi:hypothetical protein
MRLFGSMMILLLLLFLLLLQLLLLLLYREDAGPDARDKHRSIHSSVDVFTVCISFCLYVSVNIFVL